MKTWNGYEILKNQLGTDYVKDETETVIAKRCNGECGEIKTLNLFHKATSKKVFANTQSSCKVCKSKYVSERYYRRKDERLKSIPKTYWNGYEVNKNKKGTLYAVDDEGIIVGKSCSCDNCKGEIQSIDKFNIQKSAFAGVNSQCVEAVRYIKKAWNEKNLFYQKVRSANSKCKKLGLGEIDLVNFREICSRFTIGEFIKCPYCDRKIQVEDIHLEHFNPVSSNGLNCVNNVIPCCNYCNHSKWDTDFFTWSKDYFSHNSILTPYQVQKRMVDYFKKYYDIDYSDRINVPVD